MNDGLIDNMRKARGYDIIKMLFNDRLEKLLEQNIQDDEEFLFKLFCEGLALGAEVQFELDKEQ